jgi:hypothetical protein
MVEVEHWQRLKDDLRHAALKALGPEKKPEVIRRSPLSERGAFHGRYSVPAALGAGRTLTC